MVDDAKLYKRPSLLTNIKRILALPCNLDGTMYLELAAEAIIDMAIEVASPDLKEFYHHATGEPLVHDVRTVLNKTTEVKKLNKTRVIRAIGTGLGVYDSVVWALFLFYALEDALFDSTSQFLRFDPCGTGARPGDGIQWISALYASGAEGGATFQFNPGSKYYPVSPAQVVLSAANHWTGIIAASTRWRIDEFTYVPVQGRIVFTAFENNQTWVVDEFLNDDEGAAPDTSEKWNHLFARFQSPGARDGILSMQYSWHRPDLPPLAECFLSPDSHCFLSGG